jgi:hypothetical protein
MALSPIEQEMRDRFFKTLLEATFTLQDNPDRETALEALIDAAGMLQEHLERELTELRREQVE